MNQHDHQKRPQGLPPRGPGPGGPGGNRIADISGIKRKELDIPYARMSQAQMLDLYLPERPAKDARGYPVLLHIHGGGFMICDKRDDQVNDWLHFLDEGYAVASANYRLSGEAVFPSAVQDVKCAVRWLRINAARLGLDADRIAAVGGSAGGNLSAMLATSSNRPELLDDSLGFAGVSCAVRACVAWFGPTDFLAMDRQLASIGLGPCDHDEADSPESRYLGTQITKLDPALVARANPMTYIDDSLPPILLEHGDRDHLVPYLQSAMFAEEITKRLGPGRVQFEILAGADHGDPMFGAPTNMAKVRAFLERHLA